ncbi:Lcl domain-containing protein [Marinicella gelatinilytica]|uniref:Lcl domain-containing protein n=1 Tax=Marinicella gelatinilytica TaxID=2996017 RepID=UPI002260E218|nr:DUF1566 domain-containing protein [Marinicella gelatinilytica]MCX7546290.1 DUF1566 domain-containing protein [Marinicella gelatinilytica]
MKNKSISLIVFAVLILASFQNHSKQFDEYSAKEQWEQVKNSARESRVLIDLFLKERIPGSFPHQVKQRISAIATDDDVRYLVNILTDPENRKLQPFAYSLLIHIKNDAMLEPLENSFYSQDKPEKRNQLFNLITQQNSVNAYYSSLRLIDFLQSENLNSEAISLISYSSRFLSPELKNELILGTKSAKPIDRAISYIGLSNYQGDDVESLITNALYVEAGVIKGEYEYVQKSNQSNNLSQMRLMDIILTNSITNIEARKHRQGKESVANGDDLIARRSFEVNLAEKFAPVLFLSSAGNTGVNLKLFDPTFSFEDYMPINVYDITNVSDHLSEFNRYLGGGYYLDFPATEDIVSTMGSTYLNKPQNYLNFSPMWSGITTKEERYITLSPVPTVYYKIFRDDNQLNPIAIQYWFFYYYNDWVGDHAGDWESATIFLDSNNQPTEMIFSTHYEARKYSWQNLSVSAIELTHPKLFISNGGHGSYAYSGETNFFPGSPAPVNDNHLGDREVLYPLSVESRPNGTFSYHLLEIPQSESSWSYFTGKWGHKKNGPNGPLFRFDASSSARYPCVTPTGLGIGDGWECALNPPYDPFQSCGPRRDTRIAGDSDIGLHYGPWYWASGYGLNTPWENQQDCLDSLITLPTPVCNYNIGINSNNHGNWEAACTSLVHNSKYSKYYTFDLQETKLISIDLTSSVDTQMYLLEGSSGLGSLVEFDDDGGAGENAKIVTELTAGIYTVEATTNPILSLGSFYLSIGEVANCNSNIDLNTSVQGVWTNDCVSVNRSGRKAQFYNFEVSTETDVIINLESDKDAYLFLLAGDSSNSAVLDWDDNNGEGTNSRIVRTLLPGNYTLEATTKYANITGDFLVSIVTGSLTASINQSSNQADPTSIDSAKYEVVFSDPIDPATFDETDIILSGTTGTITSGLITNDNKYWSFEITGMTDGDTVVANIPYGAVGNFDGYLNNTSTSTDNMITYSSITTTGFDIGYNNLNTTNNMMYRGYDWYRGDLGSHTGIDQSEGTPSSISFGKVTLLNPDGNNSPNDICASGDCRFGNSLLVRYLHNDGTYKYGMYAHLDSFDVDLDDFVVPEQKVGTMGSTDSSVTHLHFEIKDDNMLGNSVANGWGYVPYGGGTDVNPDDYNYYNPAVFMGSSTNSIAMPILSRTANTPSLTNYDVYGTAGETIHGFMNLHGSFNASSIVVRDFNDRSLVESQGGLDDTLRFLGGQNINSSVASITGTNTYELGEYLFVPYVQQDTENRFGYPVKFEFLATNDFIIDNDQQNADTDTDNDLGTIPAYNGSEGNEVPGYYLTADLHAGRSGTFAQWKPYKSGNYEIWVHVPEKGATATSVEYVIKEDGVDSILSLPVDQSLNPNSWVKLSTASSSNFNFTDQGYVGMFLGSQVGESNYSILETEKVAFDAVKFVNYQNFPQNFKINDTGLTYSSNEIHNNCNSFISLQEDCYHGRDATNNDSSDGQAGFSFTKLDNLGQELPSTATQWSCVRDNVTGLVWEVKTDDNGLHDKDHKYTWYNPDSNSNGGFAGSFPNGSVGNGSVNSTFGFAQEVIDEKLCGLSNWRVPTLGELFNIVDFDFLYGTFDVNYFYLNHQVVIDGYDYWTNTSPGGLSGGYEAYYLDDSDTGGLQVYVIDKDYEFNVRLVSNGESYDQ